MYRSKFRKLVIVCAAISLAFNQAFFVSVMAEDLESVRKLSPAEKKQLKKMTLKPQPLEVKALQLIQDDKISEARKLLKDEVESKKDKEEISTEIYYFLSVLERKEENWEDAAKYLEKVYEAQINDKSVSTRRKVLVQKRIGDCYYGARKLKKAMEHYQLALDMSAELDPNDPWLIDLNEAVIGTLVHQKRYADAEVYAKNLLGVARKLAKSNKIPDLAALLWAQLQLMIVYRNEGKTAELVAVRDDMKNLLDMLMNLRASLDESGAMPSQETFQQIFLTEHVKYNNPQSISEYLWLAIEFKIKSLPLIEWRPADRNPTAALLCIHGLGLENRAFTFFAHEMVKRGYVVYALDVRGFGAWLTVPGQEDVGFDKALADIGAVIKLLNERHPGLPVFLLGESMGGGIALRAGAQNEESLNGVIASVPSAERFQERRMGLSVAAHFLRGPDRPFNIGESVAEKATARPEVRKVWQSSFRAKMDMTPVELMKFAVFMRTTEKKCKKIKKTPVFIVQGLKDRLVKPEGTFKMFEAVSSDDKTMLIIGTAEHLIFETDKQSYILLDSLSAWIDKHVQMLDEERESADKQKPTGNQKPAA